MLAVDDVRHRRPAQGGRRRGRGARGRPPVRAARQPRSASSRSAARTTAGCRRRPGARACWPASLAAAPRTRRSRRARRGVTGAVARGGARVRRPRRAAGGLVVLVSDFRGPRDGRRRSPAAARRHEVLAVEIRDPREDELPDVGELTLVDAETGREVRVDTSSRRLRERFADAAAPTSARRSPPSSRRLGVRHIVLSTSGSWLRTFAGQLRLLGNAAMTFACARAAARPPARPARDARVPVRRPAPVAVRGPVHERGPARQPRAAPARVAAPRPAAAVLVAAIAALVLALARPSMVVAVPREEATIILTMDVSRSMRATDVDAEPARRRPRRPRRDFVEQLPERFQVGLVAFSTDARPRRAADDGPRARSTTRSLGCGPTAARRMGDAIACRSRPPASTTAAVAAAPTPAPAPRRRSGASASTVDARARCRRGAGRADEPPLVATVAPVGRCQLDRPGGADRGGPAAAAGVPVYTIALGTPDGVVEVEDTCSACRRLPVPPDTETLAKVAELTGARFFEAPTAEDLAAIYESLGSKVGTPRRSRRSRSVRRGRPAAGARRRRARRAWFNRFP